MRRIFLLLLLLIAVNLASAATIKGNVYDFDLSKVNDSVVEINTNPQQMFVAKDGTYQFNVPVGNYILNASLKENGKYTMFTTQELEVKDDGSYRLDLIMFPEFDFEGDINESDIVVEEIPTPEQPNYLLILVVAVIVVLIVLVIFFLFLKPNKKNPETQDYDIEKLAEFIRKNKRVTQKDIRKEFPYSEAKISLMIAELEHDGKVKKIKKGRGNIIVYK